MTASVLFQLDRQGCGEVVDASVKAAAQAVWALAVEFAPVDTGTLAGSIELREAPEATVDEPAWQIGSPVNYALAVEQPGPVRKSGRRPYLGAALAEVMRRI